jgi:hypothetical protein
MAKWKLLSKHELDRLAFIPMFTGIGCGGVLLVAAGGGLLWLSGANALPAYLICVPLILLGLALLAFVAWGLSQARVRWVRIFDLGIRWKEGGTEHKYRWEEVKDVQRTEMDFVGADGRRSEWTRVAGLLLVFDDGRRVSFDPSLSEYSRLANAAQKAVTECQMARAAAEPPKKAREFGPARLKDAGVEVNGRLFRWKEIQWLAVENGELVCHYSCKQWRPVPLSEIPNYQLLLALVDEMGMLRTA